MPSEINGNNSIENVAAAAAGFFGGDDKAPRQKTDQVRNQAGIVQEHVQKNARARAVGSPPVVSP